MKGAGHARPCPEPCFAARTTMHSPVDEGNPVLVVFSLQGIHSSADKYAFDTQCNTLVHTQDTQDTDMCILQ